MTIGTGIVISVGIICITVIALAVIGSFSIKKNSQNKIAEEIIKNMKNRC